MKNTYFDKLLWVDTEFSTIDLDKALLLEIAVVVTDSNFNELTSFEAVIRHSETELEHMKLEMISNPEKPELADIDTTYDLHSKSGLLDLVRQSTTSLEELDAKLVELVDEHFPDQKPILAGNSIDYDRAIIKKHLPKLYKRLHYRVIDVTSFKLVLLNDGRPGYEKVGKHRAIDDVRESLAELKYLLSL